MQISDRNPNRVLGRSGRQLGEGTSSKFNLIYFKLHYSRLQTAVTEDRLRCCLSLLRRHTPFSHAPPHPGGIYTPR